MIAIGRLIRREMTAIMAANIRNTIRVSFPDAGSGRLLFMTINDHDHLGTSTDRDDRENQYNLKPR